MLSETFNIQIGVRQGCVLSPFLFSFFINELATQIEQNCTYGIQLHPDTFQLFLLLFADDIVLLSSTVTGLQKQIHELEIFCERSMLTVNLDKTKVVVFKKGGKLSSKEKWFYNGHLLEITSSYKYLGVYFTNQLSWSLHANYAATQALKVFYGILRQISKLGDLNMNSYFKIIDVKIKPILLYGSEIWGLNCFTKLEMVHLFACKKFLGVKQNTPNIMIYGECGRFPLYIESYCVKPFFTG